MLLFVDHLKSSKTNTKFFHERFLGWWSKTLWKKRDNNIFFFVDSFLIIWILVAACYTFYFSIVSKSSFTSLMNRLDVRCNFLCWRLHKNVTSKSQQTKQNIIWFASVTTQSKLAQTVIQKLTLKPTRDNGTMWSVVTNFVSKDWEIKLHNHAPVFKWA